MNLHDKRDAYQAAHDIARIYKALSHPARIVMLHCLTQQEACVCHLTALLGRPQPYVSQQLGILRDAGLVTDRRDGQMIYYHAADPSVAAMITEAVVLLRRRGKTVELPPARNGDTLPGCPCPQCQTVSL